VVSAPTVVDALREVALFRDLTKAELDMLARQVVQRRYGRNELIFSQADRGDGLYIVVSGHVSIGRQNPDGDELIFAMYEPGEYFGELALFDEEPRAAGATAVEDCSLLFLSRAAFRDFIDSHPKALWTCLEIVVAQVRRCTDLADEIALLDVRSRLARRLLRLAREGMIVSGEGIADDSGAFRITQQQLANMTGATRESVNKHLNAFVDEGMVRLERGRIHILNTDRLREASVGRE
jgi:CRP/FNR family transcriptional regulator, cyclic AMP receptor protein